jgi:hypothetical protein
MARLEAMGELKENQRLQKQPIPRKAGEDKNRQALELEQPKAKVEELTQKLSQIENHHVAGWNERTRNSTNCFALRNNLTISRMNATPCRTS